MTVLGLDIGYNETKIVCFEGGTELAYSFSSLVGSPDLASFSFSGSAPIVVEYAGNRYLYGNAALELSRLSQRREDRSWIESLEWAVLARAAVIESVLHKNHSFYVVAGLPVDYYAEDKLSVIAELNKITEVVWTKENRRAHYPVRIEDVIVVPQPFGSLLSEALDPRGNVTDQGLSILTEAWGVIDVGGHTTNLLVSNRASQLQRKSASVAIGGWDVVRALRPTITRNCPDLELRDHELAKAIAQGSVSYYGQPVDLSAAVQEISYQLCDTILAQATQLWGKGADLSGIMISGGGANLIGDILRSRLNGHGNVQVLSDPTFANACGYSRYGLYLEANRQ